MITADDLMHVLEEKEPMTRETYTIVINRPAGCSGNAMKRYISEAVRSWGLARSAHEAPSEINHWLIGWNPDVVVRRRSVEWEDADGSTQ